MAASRPQIKNAPRLRIERRGVSIIFRQRPTLPHGNRAVPSALEGLTSVFGMGTGGTPPIKPPENVRRSTGPVLYVRRLATDKATGNLRLHAPVSARQSVHMRKSV